MSASVATMVVAVVRIPVRGLSAPTDEVTDTMDTHFLKARSAGSDCVHLGIGHLRCRYAANYSLVVLL